MCRLLTDFVALAQLAHLRDVILADALCAGAAGGGRVARAGPLTGARPTGRRAACPLRPRTVAAVDCKYNGACSVCWL